MEVPHSSPKRCEYAEGFHLNVKSENEDRLAQEENGFGGRVIYYSDEMNKQSAPENPKSSFKTTRHAEVPEISCKTSEHAEVMDSSHKRSECARGLENIHVNVKSEHEDQCLEEHNYFGVGWTFSKELKKFNASKLVI